MDDERKHGVPQGRAVSFAHEASLGMPGSIKQVADFLLMEGTGIAQFTMAEVAARSYTSKPTPVRFAQQAGYAGWKDYRHDFLVEMGRLEEVRADKTQVDVNYPFGPSSSALDVVDSLARIQQLAAEEIREHLDQQALSDAARAIVGAKHTAFLGVMHNHHRGRIFASNLGLIGKPCMVPATDDAAALTRAYGEGDCVVVASYSGGLRHMPMVFVPVLKQRGATVVAITNSERSDLAEVADHVLSFAPLEHYHSKIAAFYSGACTSLILDALYASCYLQRFDESKDSRTAILEDLGDFLPGDFLPPR